MFDLIPNEDADTNPGCLGKALAQWLVDSFSQSGYPQATVFPEDFGYLAYLRDSPDMLWIAVTNDYREDNVILGDEDVAVSVTQPLTWNIFIKHETFFWRRQFWLKRFGLGGYKEELSAVEKQLLALIESEPRIEYLGNQPPKIP